MTLEWSNDLEEAFATAKEALAQVTMLVHPHADKPIALTVDASRAAIGAVLEQHLGSWKPVAFFSRKRPRPLVPDTWQRTVFDAVHGFSHPSIRTTKKMFAAKFVWPGLQKQVGIWPKACLRCQAAKAHRHTTGPVYASDPPC